MIPPEDPGSRASVVRGSNEKSDRREDSSRRRIRPDGGALIGCGEVFPTAERAATSASTATVAAIAARVLVVVIVRLVASERS